MHLTIEDDLRKDLNTSFVWKSLALEALVAIWIPDNSWADASFSRRSDSFLLFSSHHFAETSPDPDPVDSDLIRVGALYGRVAEHTSADGRIVVRAAAAHHKSTPWTPRAKAQREQTTPWRREAKAPRPQQRCKQPSEKPTNTAKKETKGAKTQTNQAKPRGEAHEGKATPKGVQVGKTNEPEGN